MTGTVSTRFFWPDWMSATDLRACGYAARGLWIDMLCIAGSNKGKEHGFVMLNGRPLGAADLAKVTGGSIQEIEALLAELEHNGVFSRDRRGAIYCRRMVRAGKYQTNGRLGAVPAGSPKPNQRAGLVPPDKRFRRKSFSKEERQQLFNRFGGRCRWCKTELMLEWDGKGDVPVNYMHIDHEIQLADGGNNEPENLAASCRVCNGRRSLTSLERSTSEKRPPSPIPEPEPEPESLFPNGKSPAGRDKGRTTLPADWQPTVADLEHAAEHGFDRAAAHQLAGAFADFHRSRGNRMANWSAAWRTWVRNEIKFSRGRTPPRGGGSGFAKVARRLMEEDGR